jgi:hypothetical protein
MTARLVSALVAALACAVLAACGGGGGENSPPPDPVEQVPDRPGLREAIREAQTPDSSSFPAPDGKSLQQVADLVTAGPQAALATSVLTVGRSRLTFGVIAKDGQPVYGPSAIYIASDPSKPAQGPFVAPADILLTQPRYRSKQAAGDTDPFAAVYAATPRFSKAGPWAVLVVTRSGGRLVGAPTQITVKTKAEDKVPDVGETAPKVATDTLETGKGEIANIDTRQPPSDMHEDFASVVGKKPVALIFSTPQLCESRVCGPVTDIALQMKAKYGKRMTFIHQEVYVDNQIPKGLRPPLQAFNLETEPWLFVTDKRGRVTARLEGSFGIAAFEDAVKSGL